MKQTFEGWGAVSNKLQEYAENPPISENRGYTLNAGQLASLRAIANRVVQNGVVIADEVGMGKTCIAVELARCVVESGGRVAILVPPGLGYQWQDELSKGNVEAPLILRSLLQYLAAWEKAPAEEQEPWFKKNVVVISHAFTNWRLGENAEPWRWALLPTLYAHWRKKIDKRFPRDYHDNEQLDDDWVCHAAESICAAIKKDGYAKGIITKLSEKTPWPGALNGSEYRRDQELRPWLECAVGLGLGIFDLVIIDEAHKSRGTDSGLSRLLNNVVLSSKSARRFAMTATPVELDVSQWDQTLSRIGLDPDKDLKKIIKIIAEYAEAVKQVRLYPNNQDSRDAYKRSAENFQNELTPYLLRRDKREDPAVRLFAEHSRLPITDYRLEMEITIESASLSPLWKQAVCAAEALSVVTRQADDPVAKRLRLTLGNGHGISGLLDQVKRDEEMDKKQEDCNEMQPTNNSEENSDEDSDPKRHARAQWWLGVMKKPFDNGDDALFDHPAILAAVEMIEKVTEQGEKVLVFGRFTRPLQALVNLLNAREMLRCLKEDRQWPQAKVYNDEEWHAVQVAHRQLEMEGEIKREDVDSKLDAQYKELEDKRKKLRANLIDNIEKGLEVQPLQLGDPRTKNLFKVFSESVKQFSEKGEKHPLALVGRALNELMGNQAEPQPLDFAKAFTQLLNALSDRDEGDSDGDGSLDENEARDLWPGLEERLHEEYNRPQGGFARLMYGGTKPETRRMLQLAFNRLNSFPKVLVAQSMVGREGLNLHEACRTVVLLHPEWNPGVVEQQIGRVDRVGSHWASLLNKAIKEECTGKELPRIEIRPVIFKGTYDEHNWNILRERWDDLRAQLHGIVIPHRLAKNNLDFQQIIDEITGSAPNFSPTKNQPLHIKTLS